MSQWTDAEREEALRRRAEGPLMATPLSSATVMKFVSKGVVSTEDTGPDKEDYIPSEAFNGSKPGYVFKVSSRCECILRTVSMSTLPRRPIRWNEDLEIIPPRILKTAKPVATISVHIAPLKHLDYLSLCAKSRAPRLRAFACRQMGKSGLGYYLDRGPSAGDGED